MDDGYILLFIFHNVLFKYSLTTLTLCIFMLITKNFILLIESILKIKLLFIYIKIN